MEQKEKSYYFDSNSKHEFRTIEKEKNILDKGVYMRIAICDDQLEFLEELKVYIQKYEVDRQLGINVTAFRFGEDLLKSYK